MLNDLEINSSNPKLYNVGLLVISIAQSFYIQISIIGWIYKTLHIARQLLCPWRICTEEWLDPNSSILKYVIDE